MKECCNFQKYSNTYRNNFELNEKILINDNFKLEHKTITRKNKKRGNWIINGIITKIYSYNSFKVKISNNYKDILFKEDEYYINLTMIKKVNESVWKKLIMRNHNYLIITKAFVILIMKMAILIIVMCILLFMIVLCLLLILE